MDGRRDLDLSEIDIAGRGCCCARRALAHHCLTVQHARVHTAAHVISRNAGAMGKSHRSKKLKIHEEDLRREREEAERKAALAQKRAESAERKMEVERAKSATTKFSKAVKHGKKGIGGVRGSGVRKPNYIMKKSLKKAAKAREMDEG